MTEQEEIDRLTARLRGFQTNREYWTRYHATQPPFDCDEYMTGQVNLIAQYIKVQTGEMISPSLVIELWRAYTLPLGISEWQAFTQAKAKGFEEWLDQPRERDKEERQNGGAYGAYGGAMFGTSKPLKTKI